jgi:drug/metabolite transporter (DMT)-like permease
MKQKIDKLENQTGSPTKKMNRKLAHILMIFTVMSWGFEYALAKDAMVAIEPITLVCFKYTVALFVIALVKFKLEGKSWMKRADIFLFMLCAATGEILYFYMEYEAMNYMPVSLITILLTFVPVVSILVEWVAFKIKPSAALIVGVLVSLCGLVIIVGVDVSTILQGRFIGYLLCIGAIISWNIYNFITSSLGSRYQPLTLTFNQLTCTVLLTWPLALANLPEPSEISLLIVGEVLYLGIVSGGIGFVIYVSALYTLGPTTVSVYANFMPITATFFGWLLLNEMITGMQLFGGVIVIAAGYFVIREKGKMEERYHV